MRIQHPLWRGFWLAAAMAAVLYLLGGADALAPFRLERKALVFALAIAAGAFIASLPGLLKRNRPPRERTTWQRCLRAFLSGAAMIIALSMAGSGSVIPALMTGSAGAYAFCGMALAAGFITVRILERNRSGHGGAERRQKA